MTNEELELQALEAELAALEEPTKTEEVAEVIELRAPKPRKKPKHVKIEETPVPPAPAPAPAAPTPPAPVAAPMPEPAKAIAPPAVRKTKDVRPAKGQGQSNRGIRKRNF